MLVSMVSQVMLLLFFEQICDEDFSPEHFIYSGSSFTCLLCMCVHDITLCVPLIVVGCCQLDLA